MPDHNYDTPWWPPVYDHWNERGGRQKWHEREFQFYSANLAGETGAVLEAACGTGSILFRLLDQGLDVCGFDCAEPMLATLREKAAARNIPDTDERISNQNLLDFAYDRTFAAILVPASAFMFLLTQEDQIACLRNIRAHLAPGGRLLLNFYIPSFADDLLPNSDPDPQLDELGDFPHPETGRTIGVDHKKIVDLAAQTETYWWYFTYEGQTEEVMMRTRWIYKEEFQLLLRLGGFSKWEVFGSHDGAPYEGTAEMGASYWIVER